MSLLPLQPHPTVTRNFGLIEHSLSRISACCAWFHSVELYVQLITLSSVKYLTFMKQLYVQFIHETNTLEPDVNDAGLAVLRDG